MLTFDNYFGVAYVGDLFGMNKCWNKKCFTIINYYILQWKYAEYARFVYNGFLMTPPVSFFLAENMSTLYISPVKFFAK